jgi:hypothetical protein
LTPQRDHTEVLGSNTGRCVGTSQTDYSLTKGKEHKNPIKIDGWNHHRGDKKGKPKERPKAVQPTGTKKKKLSNQ